ncbi:MAG: DUF2085 domain-containing protein [Anaerolineae bacterium]|nr:DUF2085 domain-containing protein [Anaerolineae bacterium]
MPPTDYPTPSYPPARAYRRGLIITLSLLAGIVIGLWLLGTPPGVLGKADSVGYAICHRIEARTFHIHGDHGHEDRPLPLCARCTGIYLGVITGLGTFAARGRLRAGELPPKRVLALLLLMAAVYGADGLNSYLSLFDAYHPIYQPHNTLRLITGAGFGLGMITIVLPVFNALVWRDPPDDAPLRGVRDLLVLIGIMAVVCAVVLTGQSAILWIAGVLSTAGVVLMFGVIGAVAFLTVTGRENTLTRWRDLAIPALAALTFALIVVGGIDLLRYLFTGTWAGFDM